MPALFGHDDPRQALAMAEQADGREIVLVHLQQQEAVQIAGILVLLAFDGIGDFELILGLLV